MYAESITSRIAKLSATVVLHAMLFGPSRVRRVDGSHQISYTNYNADATSRRRIDSLRVNPTRLVLLQTPDSVATGTCGTDRFGGPLGG